MARYSRNHRWCRAAGSTCPTCAAELLTLGVTGVTDLLDRVLGDVQDG